MSLGRAALAPWEVREKWALETVQEVSPGRAATATALWVQALWGPLEFRRCISVREEEGEGKGSGLLLGGEYAQPPSF